jgi:hypothetical protein
MKIKQSDYDIVIPSSRAPVAKVQDGKPMQRAEPSYDVVSNSDLHYYELYKARKAVGELFNAVGSNAEKPKQRSPPPPA